MSVVGSESLLLVGGIPRPIGGVTQHVWRLSLLMGGSRCKVCDIHPHPGKYAIDGILDVAPYNKWLRVPWLVRKMRQSPAAVSHLHFSTCSSVGLIGPFMALDQRDRFRILTLHHGNQHGVYLKLGSWMQGAVKRGLNRFDRIVYLSEDQHDFYRNIIRIAESKLFSASSYVPFRSGQLEVIESCMAAVGNDDATMSTMSVIPPKRQGTIRLVASGYPSRLYNHDHAIKFVDSLRRDVEAELYLCLYGTAEDLVYQKDLMALIADRPYVHLYREADFLDFAKLLKSADLYLRPTTVDSYGIAVADAITLGTPALASDICVRHPDAVLFPTSDFESFEATGRRILSDRQAYCSGIRSPAAIEAEIQTSLAMYSDLLTLPLAKTPQAVDSGVGHCYQMDGIFGSNSGQPALLQLYTASHAFVQPRTESWITHEIAANLQDLSGNIVHPTITHSGISGYSMTFHPVTVKGMPLGDTSFSPDPVTIPYVKDIEELCRERQSNDVGKH